LVHVADLFGDQTGPQPRPGVVGLERPPQRARLPCIDPDAWLALSLARSACGEADDRLAAAERAARLVPESEAALAEVAAASLAVGKLDQAEAAATALLAMSPRSVDHRITRAAVYNAQKQWERAEADCRAALQIHPLHAQARLLLGVCLHRRGNPEAGRREADIAAGLATQPGQREAFRQWYERETR
jgi:tetratricopeptide (TPR) repeat protein